MFIQCQNIKNKSEQKYVDSLYLELWEVAGCRCRDVADNSGMLLCLQLGMRRYGVFSTDINNQ